MSEETPDPTAEQKVFTGISAAHREIIVAMLQDGDRDMRFPVLTIGMPCGKKYIFECREEVPEQTLMCGCGDPKHIVIKYFIEDDNDTSSP